MTAKLLLLSFLHLLTFLSISTAISEDDVKDEKKKRHNNHQAELLHILKDGDNNLSDNLCWITRHNKLRAYLYTFLIFLCFCSHSYSNICKSWTKQNSCFKPTNVKVYKHNGFSKRFFYHFLCYCGKIQVEKKRKGTGNCWLSSFCRQFFFFIVKKQYSRFVFFLIIFFAKFIYFFINIFSFLRKTAVLVCKAWLKTFTLLVKNKVIPFHIFFIAYFFHNFFLCFPFRLFKKKKNYGVAANPYYKYQIAILFYFQHIYGVVFWYYHKFSNIKYFLILCPLNDK